ncbi:hypothetical protein NW766_000743 [Fusarium irregulare]|uniref:Uncharacterized protein n=1 Tax=Fusarium irregulare TaxID=2494466 RepID=A0A9W8Q2I4_9HYPO|nr:hypothetical protein NW766_000743 [Fusarium irregulare]
MAEKEIETDAIARDRDHRSRSRSRRRDDSRDRYYRDNDRHYRERDTSRYHRPDSRTPEAGAVMATELGLPVPAETEETGPSLPLVGEKAVPVRVRI